MSSDDDESPPKQLLEPLTPFQPQSFSSSSTIMATNVFAPAKKPYRITFPSREDEIEYTRKLLNNCSTFAGDPEQLSTWLKATSTCYVLFLHLYFNKQETKIAHTL